MATVPLQEDLARRRSRDRMAPARTDAGAGAPGHVVLDDGEAELVRMVADGLDINAIAVATGTGPDVARMRLRALIGRLSARATSRER